MSEDAVFRKCAWRLIPFMVVLLIVNYVDRLNVAFAALTMNRDLGFSPAVYGFAAGVFFLSYASLQVPANLILQRVGARRWVFCIMAAWGLVSASTALVRNPPADGGRLVTFFRKCRWRRCGISSRWAFRLLR